MGSLQFRGNNCNKVKGNDDDIKKWIKEERDLFQALQNWTTSSPTSSITTMDESTINDNKGSNIKVHPVLGIGLGTAFVLNMSILLSLPPVLCGKGAPYLPTFSRNLNTMFQQLKKQPLLQDRNNRKLTFVDLGSGDGRVVFAAARQPNMFHQSIGYEINPVLHGWACFRRLIQAPKYWKNTQFYMNDLWKVNLSNVDVVAVYGLQPIMKDLGGKLQNELRPGSIVVSNVFAIPGWKTNIPSTHGVHIYTIPSSSHHQVQNHLQ